MPLATKHVIDACIMIMHMIDACIEARRLIEMCIKNMHLTDMCNILRRPDVKYAFRKYRIRNAHVSVSVF